MRLKPGAEEEYKRWHDEIWPEMLDLIRAGGARNYSIFREGLNLFAYLEIEPGGTPAGGEHPVVRRWWASLEHLMESEPDGSPTIWWMTEVFHVD